MFPDFSKLSLSQVKAEAGLRTDSEGTSSEGSQSRSRTHSATTPSPTTKGELAHGNVSDVVLLFCVCVHEEVTSS